MSLRMAALQTMVSHSMSSSSLCHSSSAQPIHQLYRSKMAASDLAYTRDCSSSCALPSSVSLRKNSASSGKRQPSNSSRSAHDALFRRPQVSPATGCCIASGSEQNHGYEYGRRSTTAITVHHANPIRPSLDSDDGPSTAWNRLVAVGTQQETAQLRHLSETGNQVNDVQHQLTKKKKNQPTCGFTARGLEGYGRPDVIIGSAQPLTSLDDRFSWSPVADWRSVDCGLVTSSMGQLPKLTRAVSEYSLYGQRCTGEHKQDGEDSACRNDVSWRHAKQEGSPPRLAPISGQLSKVASQTVIRPVPYRAIPLESVKSSSRRVSGPPDISGSSCTPSNAARPSTDDGYSSSSRSYVTGKLGNHSSSSDEASNSASGLNAAFADMVTMSGDCDDCVRPIRSQQDGDRLRRQSSSGIEKVTVVDVDWRQERPSTAAAMFVSELEAELRGKEAELRRLRETMEKNETAIVDVLQERRRSWQAQMTALSTECERKLRADQQKAFRTEQSLLLQVFRLQQDNRDLMRLHADQRRRAGSHDDEDDITERRRSIYDQNGNDSDGLRAARARLDEMRWELDERTAEVAAMSDRLTAAESRARQLDAELAASRQQTEDETARDNAAERDASETVDRLRVELERVRTKSDREKIEFECERERWLDEKRRVIEYQKQLQLNYVQMARKNKLLESNIQQLLAVDIEGNTTTPDSASTPVTAGGNHARSRPVTQITNIVDVDESMC